MHELSIAQSLLAVVEAECRKGGYQRVEAVNVRIGKASGILPDALLFAFDAIKAETCADGAVLNIEEVPLTGNCRECRSQFTVEEEFVLNCPACRGSSFVITAGRELDIIDMEVS